MFNLDLRSRTPIYEQLVDKFKELIINDILQKDEKLPSVRTLAQELTINPNTIQKAYRELEVQGYIYSLQGKGSFVHTVIKMDNKKNLEKIKEAVKKYVAEAYYVGVKKEELHQMIDEVIQQVGGDEKND